MTNLSPEPEKKEQSTTMIIVAILAVITLLVAGRIADHYAPRCSTCGAIRP
jgi:hypothetical protein